MRFFVPAEDDPETAEQVYQAIVKFASDNMGPVRAQRYYAIYYRHNGKELKAVVGGKDPLTGELVVAILRTERESGPFLVCTPNRGVARGEPIMASGGDSTRAIHFEME